MRPNPLITCQPQRQDFVRFPKRVYNSAQFESNAWETTEIAPLNELTSKLISVSEASRISGLTPSYIARLLRQRDIEGVKMGRDWWTTAEAIRAYLKQERRPGPKPRKKPK